MAVYRLTPDDDSVSGTSGNDVVEVPSGNDNLSADDHIAARAGHDILRFERPVDLSVSYGRLDGVSGIDEIDVRAAPSVVLSLSDDTMRQSDDDALRITFDGDPLALDLRALDPWLGTVVLNGSGAVTLYDAARQSVTVASGVNGRITGGDGDDALFGGSGDDRFNGGAGYDRLEGGSGDDRLAGGDDADVISGGTGRNTVSGGAGSDTFVVSSGETLTISDFNAADPYERIDLRDVLRSGQGYGSLTITKISGGTRVTAGDATITLSGVSSGSLGPGNFVFPGDDVRTLAEGLGTFADFEFTDGWDRFTGGSGSQIFEIKGNFGKLTSDDRFDGGSGVDTLRVWGNDRALSADRLVGMSGIEIIDMTGATGKLEVQLDQDMVDSSSTGRILVAHGANDITMLTGRLDDASNVVVEGTGIVRLRDVPNQGVTISDSIAGDVRGQNKDDMIVGGALNDTITGSGGDDTLSGGGGADKIYGGDDRDVLSGGSGRDVLSGGAGADVLIADGGADVLSGGTGSDSFVLRPGSVGTVITDYDPGNLVERIDLTGFSSLTGMKLVDTKSGVHVTANGGLDITLTGVKAAQLDGDDFLFRGEDGLSYRIEVGTSTARIQQILDGAPENAVITFDAGTFNITDTLRIDRSDITLTGAGEGKTILRTMIPDADAAPTILVQPKYLADRLGAIASDATKGSTKVTLADGHDLQPGDLLYLSQANDDAWLRKTGNTGWIDPGDKSPGSAEDYYLRETRSEVVSVNGNTVTLREPLPYTFEGGVATAARSTFLTDVTLSDFSVVGRWGTPDPFEFEDTMPAWTSIAAVELDGVRDSLVRDITVTDPAAHAFKFQRTYDVRGHELIADGAHNKSGSSGYHFYLSEAFATTLTSLTSIDARHAVLFSSYSAEHYNDIQMRYTNRDINFHGSPDSDNTVVVDVVDQDYPAGSDPQWMAVHPGVFPLHPRSTIEDNDVTFKSGQTGERNDTITAFSGGGTLSTGVGNDSIIGSNAADVIDPGPNGDTVRLGGGRDLLIREFEDLTDTIVDFRPGSSGDIMAIKGSAYARFDELSLRQVGSDVVLDFGTGGSTIFENTRVGAFTAANFRFVDGDAPGQRIEARAIETFIVATDRSDTIQISRYHLEDPGLRILGGAGYDTVKVVVSSLNANLGATGDYSGVEEFDLSGLNRIVLSIDNALVSQSNNNELVLALGNTGETALLDIGAMGRGKAVLVDGAREVQLTGGGEHLIKSTDRVGVSITGADGRDVIYGGRSDDRLDGGGGNDVVFGAAGNDTLLGGAGADILNGGPGSDVFVVNSLGDKVAESRRWAGTDHVDALVDFRMGTAHIETLRLAGNATLGAGNGLKNTIWGNDRANVLDGGKNVDTLIGGAGNDTYLLRAPGDTAVEVAGEGIDSVKAFRSIELDANVENLFIQTLRNKAGEGVPGVNGFGNGLDNTIVGNPFDNVLGGRGGADTMRGQAGADAFVFDTAPGAGQVDRILDFNRGEGDTIRLDDGVFAGLAAGPLAEGALALGTEAGDANDRVIYDRGTGRLWVDGNGSAAGGQVLIAVLENHAALAASDVLVF